MEEIELADQVGLDVYGVGEHHRPDFVVSAPAVVFGAAAVRTRRIRLTSAVTVLSSDDPVRVFQNFATVDLLSGGRAEIMAGRGSFIESPCSRRSSNCCSGRATASASPGQGRIVRVELYRQAAERAGHDPSTLAVSINFHAYVADDSHTAADEFFSSYAEAMSRIGRERGWPPTTRAQFEALRSPHGALAIGSPQEVIDKILRQHELFHHQRFFAQLTVGTMPHRGVMRAIELLGTQVAPVVRREVGVASAAR